MSGNGVTFEGFTRLLLAAPRDRQRAAIGAGIAALSGETAKTDSAGRGVLAVCRRVEAAKRLGVSLRTIDSLMAQGVLARVRFPGRKRAVGVSLSSVEDVVLNGCGEG